MAPWENRFPAEIASAIRMVEKKHSRVITRWVKDRKSKLGDYRPPRYAGERAQITLNAGMNLHQSLIVWIHEFAHHQVWLLFGNKVQPHGIQWKKAFADLYFSSFEKYFSPEWQNALRAYFNSPTAATFSHKALQDFKPYLGSEEENQGPTLLHLEQGDKFEFQGRQFKMERMLRTFALCIEISTQKKYRIRANCSVDLIP